MSAMSDLPETLACKRDKQAKRFFLEKRTKKFCNCLPRGWRDFHLQSVSDCYSTAMFFALAVLTTERKAA